MIIFYDLYLIFSSNVDLNRHIPFLPTLVCLGYIAGLIKAEKYMDKHLNKLDN